MLMSWSREEKCVLIQELRKMILALGLPRAMVLKFQKISKFKVSKNSHKYLEVAKHIHYDLANLNTKYLIV
jgi:hypothetical protein